MLGLIEDELTDELLCGKIKADDYRAYQNFVRQGYEFNSLTRLARLKRLSSKLSDDVKLQEGTKKDVLPTIEELEHTVDQIINSPPVKHHPKAQEPTIPDVVDEDSESNNFTFTDIQAQ